MSNLMTNYNERLDEILYRFAVDTHESKPGQDETPNFDKAKQAITSLTKELVAEAKPERQPPMKMGNPTKESSDLDKMIFAKKKGHNEAIDQFEQNLLKALEEK